MKLLAGIVLAFAAGQAAAAPFCVVASYGQQCWYYDYPSCQRAAQQARGACVAQQEQQSAPQYQPRRSSGPPFCVVSANGTNCWYYDAPSCQQAARQSQGACVVNPDN